MSALAGSLSTRSYFSLGVVDAVSYDASRQQRKMPARCQKILFRQSEEN
jgi:hypothetical protein